MASLFVPWTLEEALVFVRSLADPLETIGFSVGLLGSVLLNGESNHDLDLVIYPWDTGRVDLRLVSDLLIELGMTRLFQRHEIAKFWARKGSLDAKHVEVWETSDRKRVDLFFMR